MPINKLRPAKSTVARMADAIEWLSRTRDTVCERDVIALGFSQAEIVAFGPDAIALHARQHPHAVAA